MNKGFTLIEVLVVVLIVAVLTGIALPKYMRSLERARATEAMSNVKAINEAVYAYSAGREGQCPTVFSKLLLSVSGTPNAADTTRTTKNFIFTLNDATGAQIPGTNCPGVTAKRNAGARFDYVIWNPYQRGQAGQAAALACTSEAQASIDVCESLGLYTEGLSPYSSGGSGTGFGGNLPADR